MANWWVDTTPGPTFPGGTAVGGGGGGITNGTAGAIQYRSPLDARRAASGVLPQAEYPDGYLGTITDRHQDKLFAKVQERLTDRSYQRGVHKGAKIDGNDYFWDKNIVDPMGRIKKEAQGKPNGYTIDVQRYAPKGNPVERLAHMGKTAGLSTPEQIGVYKQYGVSVAKNPVVVQDPTHRARMQKMLPSYARTM